MRVEMVRAMGRRVAGAVLVLILGCGEATGGLQTPDTVVYVSLLNNTSSVDVTVHIVSAYATDTIPVLAGGQTGTNQTFGEAGDFLTFRVTAPGANGTVDCEVSPQIIVEELSGPPNVYGEVIIVADGVTTTVTCGNNWQ